MADSSLTQRAYSPRLRRYITRASLPLGNINRLNTEVNFMVGTLTELSQRDEAFWIGLALFLLGVITPETLLLGGIELSIAFVWIGGGILMTRLLVGSYRILKTTVGAGVIGYREAIRNDE